MDKDVVGGLMATIDNFTLGHGGDVLLRAKLEAALLKARRQENERCAVIAWNTGMEEKPRLQEAREVGSRCAAAIRTSFKEKTNG